MAAEVWAALYDADRHKWWPSQSQTREREHRDAKRRERAEKVRRAVRGRG